MNLYCDNAATTRMSDSVLKAMLPYLKEQYGNPSSMYSLGRKAKQVIEEARQRVAKAINAEPCEIYFTSGATEANNWAIKNIYEIANNLYDHFTYITSKIEHKSILNTLDNIDHINSKCNNYVRYIDVDNNGIVSIDDIKYWINTSAHNAFVTIQMVNNEIGTIQPIKEIAKICKENGVIFHTDATQAIGHINIDVKELGVGMLSLSGHKFHAPKGIGVLYIRKNLLTYPFLHGGGQENGKRGGTENVAAIVGLGVAITETIQNLDTKISRVTIIQKQILSALFEIPDTHLNGSLKNRIPNNINICFKGVDAENLVLQLDTDGISVSAGSACNSMNVEPSYVLKAIGLSDDEAKTSIRISFEDMTDKEINYLIEKIKLRVEQFRKPHKKWKEK